MGTICSVAHNHIETDAKHTLWNRGLDIRGLRSLGGLKIQCLSELASAIKDNVPATKLKIHKRKELQIEGITYMGLYVTYRSRDYIIHSRALFLPCDFLDIKIIL